MDCQDVRELLDAYALGATEQDESEGLEGHVADCVRCWEELNEAQRTAALLSLSVAIHEAPASLRDRILSQVERDRGRERGIQRLRQAVRRVWPVSIGAVAVAGVAALVFAAVLQFEVNELQDDNSDLARQIQSSGAVLNEQQQMLAVLTSPDMQELSLEAVAAESEASAVYYWSRASQRGVLVCNNLPGVQEGQVYQAWLLKDGEWRSAGNLEHFGGISQLSMDLSGLHGPPEAIAVSVEGPGGAADRPSGQMLFMESFSGQ